MSRIEEALLSHLVRQGRALPEPERLRYSSDLSPDACERSIYYRLSGAPRDSETLGDQLRFRGGHIFEGLLRDAVRAHYGRDGVLDQVDVRPLRPSSWAFAAGHADLVLVKDKHLLEVKAPRGNAFDYAGANNHGLVREGYRWQASAYFHELKARGLVETGSWVFLDREGSHAPVEVPLDGELLIPLDKVIDEERRKCSTFWPKAHIEVAPTLLHDAPPRLKRDVLVTVNKGRMKDPVMCASSKLSWRCSYCSFSKTCNPGAKDGFYELTDSEKKTALDEAKKRWSEGETRVVVKLPQIPNDDPPVLAAEEPSASPLVGGNVPW